MPCCTFLGNKEFTKNVQNEHLMGLLSEVREKTKKDWRLEEREFSSPVRFWQKKKTVKLYMLYVHVYNSEFQIINFYKETGDSLPGYMSADCISAYLYGILVGLGSRVAVDANYSHG